MVLNDAVLAGGFALAGVSLQQILSMLSESRRFAREERTRRHTEQHAAFVDLVTAGRRVQRALAERNEGARPGPDLSRLGDELDRLTEAAVVVRLIVEDESLLTVVEQFEDRAKRIEARAVDPGVRLELTTLIRAIQSYEAAQTAALT